MIGEERRHVVRSMFVRTERRAPETVDAPRKGLFSAIQQYPAFRQLWMGSLLGQLAQWMQSVALGWIALELTDSALYVGVVSFMAGIPFIVVAIPAGMLIDRFDRRAVLLICQAAAAILASLVAVDILAGLVEPWHLLIAAFLNGSLLAIMTPTQQALTPSLVPREDLTNAIGLTSAGNNMARVFGPSLAGMIIGFSNTGIAFLLQAAALILAFVLIARARFPKRERAISIVKPTAALDGLAYILRRDDLRVLFLLVLIPTFFTFPYIQFLNVFAVDVLGIGAAKLGVMMATSGVGAVTGSLIIAGRRTVTAQGRLLLALTIIYGVVIFGLSMVRSFPLTIPFLFLGGVLGSMFMSQNNALVQHRISDEMRGRVLGAYMLNQGLLPLGALPMGILAGATSVPFAMAVGASLTIVATILVALTSNAWRSF
jgi:MFS family permease